jgi:CBS domain containing-hemolysin-like protein
MIIRRNNGRFLVDALCPVDDLTEACHLTLPEVTSDTTGGLIVELLGHIPEVGEKLRIGRHELTVLEAEPTRVRRVEVQEIEPEPGAGVESPARTGVETRETTPESAEATGHST